MKLSIVFNVLESYEVVRRHILYFDSLFQTGKYSEVEIIFIDDGSLYPIKTVVFDTYTEVSVRFPFVSFYETKDNRPWTQCLARNLGAVKAKGEYILFSDIDHIVTGEILDAALAFTGDKMEFTRRWGVFDALGNVVEELNTLRRYGLHEKDIGKISKPFNIFCIKKVLFDKLGGYNPKYAGRYGGEDIDFANRYRDDLYKKGLATRSVRGPRMYVYPDPARDVQRVFHSLRRRSR